MVPGVLKIRPLYNIFVHQVFFTFKKCCRSGATGNEIFYSQNFSHVEMIVSLWKLKTSSSICTKELTVSKTTMYVQKGLTMLLVKTIVHNSFLYCL